MPHKDPEARKVYLLEYRKRPHVQEKGDAYRRAYKEKHREKARRYQKLRNLTEKGWTQEQLDKALQDQDGRCWICRVVLENRPGLSRLCADHNHETGQRRGILCHRCNVVEGLLKASGLSPAEWASRLELYLATFDEPLKE